jgi:metal-sulfur cluster biosynthetic enzyme
VLDMTDAATGVPVLPPRWREALERVIDPESGLNIVDMGLVAGLQDEADALRLQLIMTSAACPMAGVIAEDAEAELMASAGPGRLVEVHVLDEPAWTPERLSATGRERMGWQPDEASP